MGYRIQGLDPTLFDRYRGRSDAELAAVHAERVVADAEFGYPCRISLTDAKVGESLILLNFEHQPVASPYRSTHAIFINESSLVAGVYEDELPRQLSMRLLSVRAFDDHGKIINAEVINGVDAEPLIERMLAEESTAYLHVHNAKRGCFAARIDRS